MHVSARPVTERIVRESAKRRPLIGLPAFRPLRGRNSTLAITLTPAAFYLTGLAKHRHSQNTGLLVAEAVADTQIVSFAMKHAFGR